MSSVIVAIRRKKLKFDRDWSKADIARYLLAEDDNYSVSEISKAVPMAYSQVHQIAAKLGVKAEPKPKKSREDALIRAHGMQPTEADRKLGRGTPGPYSRKRMVEAKVSAGRTADRLIDEVGVSPLRRNAKGAKELGPCANCGFALVGQMLGGQHQMTHFGMSPEEYRDVVQFCHAFPKSLEAKR